MEIVWKQTHYDSLNRTPEKERYTLLTRGMDDDIAIKKDKKVSLFTF